MTMLRPSWENRGQALGAREKGTKGKKMCGNENVGNMPHILREYKPKELVSMRGVPRISREYKPEELVSMRGVPRIFGIFRNAECY